MHTETVPLTRSREDYLETILFLVRQGQGARVRDIARQLHVGMPSVTSALRALSKRQLVNYDPYEVVTLTDSGRRAAEEVSRRHDLLLRFLTEVLCLDEGVAEANACRMEHAVDDALLKRLDRFMEFLRHWPRIGNSWVESLSILCDPDGDPDPCRQCGGRVTDKKAHGEQGERP